MRVIAGTARGRHFDAPSGMETRPTLDRVKESFFGSIQFEIFDKTVLDLFSGSGNLGIEALSRNARFCYFNDSSRECARIIKENLTKLGFFNAAVYNTDYLQALNTLKRADIKLDIVFLDPPYASLLAQNAVCELCRLDLLSDCAIVVAEHSKQQIITPPDMLYVHSVKNYKDTAVTILKRNIQ